MSSPTAIIEPIKAPDWLTSPIAPRGSSLISDSDSVDDSAVFASGLM